MIDRMVICVVSHKKVPKALVVAKPKKKKDWHVWPYPSFFTSRVGGRDNINGPVRGQR